MLKKISLAVLSIGTLISSVGFCAGMGFDLDLKPNIQQIVPAPGNLSGNCIVTTPDDFDIVNVKLQSGEGIVNGVHYNAGAQVDLSVRNGETIALQSLKKPVVIVLTNHGQSVINLKCGAS